MKTIALLFLLITTLLHADDGEAMAPEAAIEKFGNLTVSDGSSYFTFNKDGTFRSGPLGDSGRTFEGRWKKTGRGGFTAVAKMGWDNGVQPQDEYRRIVILISGFVKLLAGEKSKAFHVGSGQLFDGCFMIDEMVRIAKSEYEKGE